MKSKNLIAAAILFVGIGVNTYADENRTFSENQICKAGIAKIMGRNPAIIKIDRFELPGKRPRIR